MLGLENMERQPVTDAKRRAVRLLYLERELWYQPRGSEALGRATEDPVAAFLDTGSQASETTQEWYDRHPELERPPAAFAAVPSSSGSPSQVSHAVASCWLVAPVALLFHALLSGWRELCFSWEPAALACGAVRL